MKTLIVALLTLATISGVQAETKRVYNNLKISITDTRFQRNGNTIMHMRISGFVTYGRWDRKVPSLSQAEKIIESAMENKCRQLRNLYEPEVNIIKKELQQNEVIKLNYDNDQAQRNISATYDFTCPNEEEAL